MVLIIESLGERKFQSCDRNSYKYRFLIDSLETNSEHAPVSDSCTRTVHALCVSPADRVMGGRSPGTGTGSGISCATVRGLAFRRRSSCHHLRQYPLACMDCSPLSLPPSPHQSPLPLSAPVDPDLCSPPSPPSPRQSLSPLSTPADFDTPVQVDALHWLFYATPAPWPPGLESHCLQTLLDRIAQLALDLADAGYPLSDETLMAVAERHMPDSCSALRTAMRCPYPPTFAAYSDKIIKLATGSVRAAVYSDAVQRLETSIIPPSSPIDLHTLCRQLDYTLKAAADWSWALNGVAMDDCLLQFYFERALPLSYAPLRIILRRAGLSSFRDYYTGLMALASVDAARLELGLPTLSASAGDALDFVCELAISVSPPQPSPLRNPISYRDGCDDDDSPREGHEGAPLSRPPSFTSMPPSLSSGPSLPLLRAC